jgi:uncharacterized protein (TIGR00299 family) protein
MNLGALLDLGIDEEYMRSELAKLPLEDEFEMVVRKEQKRGITGTRVEVNVKNSVHPHRKLKDIEKIIAAAGFSTNIQKKALGMFERIARAEAKVHNRSVYEVHFHEVGAVDSLVDITGAAVALDALHVDRIEASSVQVGGGFVQCAHGLLPVPAPATVELLAGVPVKTGLVPYETTTPTGAAILASNVDRFTDETAFTILRTGYGLGTREFEVPNVLRVYLGETSEDVKKDEQFVLETNIDDMNPEIIGFAEEMLFKAGALDVFKTPIIMKKGRPAIQMSVLTDRQHEQAVMGVLFSETTTIGLRKIKVQKLMLRREQSTVDTQYGTARIKKSFFKEQLVNVKPDYEDVRKLALEHSLPISAVYREIQVLLEKEKKR